MKKNLEYNLNSPVSALLIFGGVTLLGLFLLGLLSQLLITAIKRPEASMRIAAVFQDVLVFIVPAFVAALLSTRLPARLLAVDRKPDLRAIFGAIIVLLVASPALNYIIDWNQSWQLPESMAAVEEYMRNMEERAQAATELLLGGHSVGSLIMSVLIVAVLAGFSEELFFHGALQRILMATRINAHVVIWLVAFIFSAFHMQIYGLVPRMLLGAFFGYLLWWTRCLWIPVFMHIFNNAVVVVSCWKNGVPAADGDVPDYLSGLPVGVQIAIFALSVILTAVALRYLYLLVKHDKHTGSISDSSAEHTPLA